MSADYTYPRVVVTAAGRPSVGYQGVVQIVYHPGGAGYQALACAHRHRSNRAALSCGARLAGRRGTIE